ncbi:hypothetical protein JCM9279_001681 [Rhodotorula babjevae]
MQAEPSRRPYYTLPPAPLADDDDPILQKLATVIGWWLPCLEGVENRKYRNNAVVAVESFRKGWGILLPWERERAVDLLVSSWCAWQVDRSRVDPNAVLSYLSLSNEVKRTISTIRKSQAEGARHKLLVAGREVVDSSPSPAVEAWFAALFTTGVQGLTVAKLLRVPQEGWRLILQTLEHGQELMREGVPPRRALPSLDLLFDTAHQATQTPTERSEIFHRCINDLLTLCESARCSAQVLRAGHKAYVVQRRSVLLGQDEARRFQTHLNHIKQAAAVELARTWLFSACRGHALKHAVPDLAVVAHDLYRATGHDETATRRALEPPANYLLPKELPEPSTYRWSATRTVANAPENEHSLRSLSIRPRRGERSPSFPDSRALLYL